MVTNAETTRRPTAPIPSHLVERFYQVAWDIAADGTYCDQWPELRAAGRRFTVRRHALACLWLTACAMRFSELARLRAHDVSEAGYSAFITRSKGGLSGQVELSRRLVALTFEWRSERSNEFSSEWLLSSRTGNRLSINTFNRDACGMFRGIFGIPLTSHCFRDTACQMAIVQGASVRVVQRLLGHKSAITTEHYLRKQQADSFQLRLFEGEYSEAAS